MYYIIKNNNALFKFRNGLLAGKFCNGLLAGSLTAKNRNSINYNNKLTKTTQMLDNAEELSQLLSKMQKTVSQNYYAIGHCTPV